MRYCCLIILLVTLFTACKKSGDNIPPTIEITVPAYMSGFQVFDFVNVEAIVRDRYSKSKFQQCYTNDFCAHNW